MNVTVENLAPCKKLVRVEVAVEKVNEAFETTTKDFQRQVSLPGFRPGKAPRDMVAKRFENDIIQEVKKTLTRDSYQNAIRDQKLSVVGYPDIEEIQFSRGQAYQFAATVETAPDFTLPEYKGLSAKRENATVTDADVTRAINMLRERKTDFKTVVRDLKEGDIAVVNYQGTSDGKPLTDIAPTAKGLTEQKNFWINTDKGSFIPGFAEQLVGAKAGDKRTVNVEFPADFVTPQLAGKKGIYEVELVEVKEKILPELNDEFAKSFGADNLDKLREGVRTDLEADVKMKQENKVREQVVNSLLNQVQCELPESSVVQETRNLVYNIVNDNQKRGIPKEAIEAQKDQIYANASATAKDRVKASFLFSKIAEKESIKVEQSELAQRVHQMATSYQVPMDKLVKDLQKNNGFPEIYEQLLNEKVITFLVQNAKIEEVAAPVAKE